jgi:hypothetical protein
MKLNRLLVTSLASLASASMARADVTVVVAGGNASRAVQFDRAAALLTGETVVNGPNSNVRSFVGGTISNQPGLGNVTIHFVLNGALGGVQSLRDQSPVSTATGASLPPQVAVSGSYPETVGIDGSIFNSTRTLVIPFAYVKNPALPNTLAGVTNLTQRQAALLQATSGTLPTAFFGGESTTDIVYAVGRDTAAAVRQVIDANIYFTGSPSFYTTNALGKPIPNPKGGHDGGGKVVSDLLVIPNAIGTVAASDIGNLTPLAYEGFLPTADNVAKGKYPIWGYESWYLKNSGTGQPTAAQAAVINALLAAITDPTYQTTSPLFTGVFVPLSTLEVERTADGGPITSVKF